MSGFLHRASGRRARLRFGASGLLAMWIVLHLLAVLPNLHHALHEETASPDHQCPLTEFVGGICDAPPMQPAPGGPEAPAFPAAAIPEVLGPKNRFEVSSAPRPPPASFQTFSFAGS